MHPLQTTGVLSSPKTYCIWCFSYYDKKGGLDCGLAIHILKAILRQNKSYGNSNISPCKNIIFKKPKIFGDIIVTS
jgi:hypothetical protein